MAIIKSFNVSLLVFVKGLIEINGFANLANNVNLYYDAFTGLRSLISYHLELYAVF